MSDAEIAVAVAQRCGIPYEATSEGWPLLIGHRDVGRVGRHVGPFDPANSWQDAMTAAEKCGLFAPGRHDRMLYQTGDAAAPEWVVAYDTGQGHEITARDASGPRCISTAILALPAVTI